jgi:hypothetical protein
MTNVLHIYGQSFWHDEAFIVGNREGLATLRDAITRALESESGAVVATAYVNDGEGFDIGIYRVHDENTDRISVPYTDETAAEKRDEAVHPWKIASLADG